MCYIFKLKNQKKTKEYRIEFNEVLRYLIQFNCSADKLTFVVTIRKNDQLFTRIEFATPGEFFKKLCDETSPRTSKFVELLLTTAGFRL